MKKRNLTPKGKSETVPAAEFKTWRKERMKWTQRQAAAWLQVPLKAYQKWEQGYRSAHNPGPIRLRMKQARPRSKEDSSTETALEDAQ